MNLDQSIKNQISTTSKIWKDVVSFFFVNVLQR
jgi:hypothetical protein